MRAYALSLLVLIGCDASGGADGGMADVPDGVRCSADFDALMICEGGECRSEPCRGDELCQAGACVPWTSAALSVDFSLSYTEAERGILVEVVPGGFPRAQAEAIRFTFGDGVAGWGETLRHGYAEPGVYPVDLEVRLTGHRVLRASKVAVLGPLDGHDPLFLTVDEIPRYLNGSVPLTRTGGTPDDPSDDVREPFMLQLPHVGFTVDVTLLEDPSDPIERESLSLTADVQVGEAAAGEELVDRLVFDEGAQLGVTRAHWSVEEAFPEGQATLTLRARTASGAEHTSALTVEIVTMTAERDPFDRPMRWLFRDDTDFFTIGAAPAGVTSVAGPNGVADLIEELTLIGAQGEDAALNARYLAWIQGAIRADVYRYFGIGPDGAPHDGIALTIAWQGEPDAPDAAAFSPDGDFSMIRFGGHFADGFLGYSGFAPYNEERVDDSIPERGVATATLIQTLLTAPAVSAAFEPLLETPVGAHDADRTVLDPAFDPYAEHDPAVLERYAALRDIARYLALAIGSVTAHEMGHAMGLMPNGAPPLGYFGGVLDVSFIDPAHTNAHHADFPGLNLMQAGGGFLEVINQAIASLELPRDAELIELAEIIALENRLGPYERAYLQGRLTYASFDGGPSALHLGCR